MGCPSIGRIKEILDIRFRSTGDDNSQPLSLCGGIGQDPQEGWTTFIVTTFVERVNYKDEGTFWATREFADEVKEDRGFHRIWGQVWVFSKAFCHNASKGREDDGEFIDESRKDIFGFAQVRVIPPAEEGPSKVVLIVKFVTDRMS